MLGLGTKGSKKHNRSHRCKEKEKEQRKTRKRQTPGWEEIPIKAKLP
jgi:hypothetical protein